MSIGIGIVGWAHGHVGMYCSQWRNMPAERVRVVAGWDHDAERAKTNAQQYGVDNVTDLDALLRRKDIDAVVIGIETSMHADAVEKAAPAGKAIVLQKPMALTMEQADRIVAAVEKADAPFSMAWQMRVDPQNLKMREMVRGGEIGRIFMVRRRHGLSTHTWANFENLWHAKKELNRGMWADDAAHAIDFLYWLLGMPQTVTAEIDTLLDPKVPDDNGIAIYRYADGMMAEVVCSFVCPAHENTTEIVGEKGVIIQNYGDAISAGTPRQPGTAGLKWFIQGQGWTNSDTPSPASHGDRIFGLAGSLVEFLHGERPAIATAREGRDALRMVLASYQAAEQGRRIRIT